MQTGLIALLGLATLFVGLILSLILPQIRLILLGVLGLGVVLLVIAFVLDYRRVGRALVSRRGRFGTSTTLMVSIFVGIILLANAISIGNNTRIDTTGLSQYTLTSQTRETLSSLEEPVEVIEFFVPGDVVGNFLDDLLSQYQNFTDKLTVRRIDPEQHPDQARLYGAVQYPSVAFVGDSGQRLVRPVDIITQLQGGEVNIEAEYAFTSAILEVTGTVQRKVYFLTGHGENNVLSTASGQYSTVREGLMDNLFQVETLDIRLGGDIPEDAALLVIAGPRAPLEPREVEAIGRYLDKEKPALILVNPNPSAEMRELIARWGLDIEDGLINDEESYAEPNKDSPLVPPIRNYFARVGMIRDIYFPGATALIPQEEPPAGLLHVPLVWTSKQSWLEKDFRPGQERRFDQGKDVEGPLAIGVLVAGVSADAAQSGDEQPTLAARAIIFGDSDFAANGHFQNGDNGSLFLSSVSVLTAGTELITMDRKVLQTRRLIVSPEAKSFIEISSMALLPIVVLAIGGIIWWRRR